MKHLEHTLETYVYSHCNMCNIPIYFCNIKMKHLQHLDETSEILKTYSCNMSFAWTRHADAEVDGGGAWTLLCDSGTGNSLAGAASHKSRPPRLLTRASVMEARRFGGSGCSERAGRREQAAWWRLAR